MNPKTLEQIKLYCDEAQAAIRAGIPLDGLSHAEKVKTARLPELIQRVQKQSADGQSISTIIDSAPTGPERVVTASIAAGLSSGRLEQSLEILGDLANEALQIRSRIKSALLYPMIIVVMASGLFAFFVRYFLESIGQVMRQPEAPPSLMLQKFLWFNQHFAWWPAVIPATIILLVVVPTVFKPEGILSLRGPEKLVLLIPGVRSVLTSLQFYTASRTLTSLLDQNVPLADALVIAGTCSERAALDASFRKAATRLNNGTFHEIEIPFRWKSGQLPPLLTAALKDSQGNEERLHANLSGITAHYFRRLNSGLLILRNNVPAGLTIFVAGSTVLLYSIAVFWPMTELYTSVVRESSLVIP